MLENREARHPIEPIPGENRAKLVRIANQIHVFSIPNIDSNVLVPNAELGTANHTRTRARTYLQDRQTIIHSPDSLQKPARNPVGRVLPHGQHLYIGYDQSLAQIVDQFDSNASRSQFRSQFYLNI